MGLGQVLRHEALQSLLKKHWPRRHPVLGGAAIGGTLAAGTMLPPFRTKKKLEAKETKLKGLIQEYAAKQRKDPSDKARSSLEGLRDELDVTRRTIKNPLSVTGYRAAAGAGLGAAGGKLMSVMRGLQFGRMRRAVGDRRQGREAWQRLGREFPDAAKAWKETVEDFVHRAKGYKPPKRAWTSRPGQAPRPSAKTRKSAIEVKPISVKTEKTSALALPGQVAGAGERAAYWFSQLGVKGKGMVSELGWKLRTAPPSTWGMVMGIPVGIGLQRMMASDVRINDLKERISDAKLQQRHTPTYGGSIEVANMERDLSVAKAVREHPVSAALTAGFTGAIGGHLAGKGVEKAKALYAMKKVLDKIVETGRMARDVR